MRCPLRVWLLAGSAAVVVTPSTLHAQSTANEPARIDGRSRDEALESYLERLRLNALLAEQLESKLAATNAGTAPAEKQALAERLAKLYVDLLSGAGTTEDRVRWEGKAQKLLEQVPEVESFALRLNLHRVVYNRAEEIVERHRLRLATTEEVTEAGNTLRGLADQFESVATKVNRRVDSLEKAEAAGAGGDSVSADLAEMRRLRSLAFYYAGWSNLYVATVGKVEPAATDAQRDFGWLLNSSNNRLPQVDRVQPTMYQYEHIARAAMGCALAAGLKGNETEALRWLDAIADSDQTAQSVREQLPSRRLIVLAGGKRWFDVELLVRRERRALRSGPGPETKPLSPAMARLLAVSTLEADRRSNVELLERLTKIALGDLVAQKQITQVLDLVSRYGNVPLGDTGFIPNFVRAVQVYESARKKQTGGTTSSESDEPTTDPKLINEYKQAASLFGAAATQTDADQFPVERLRSGVMHGRALYFAGSMIEAADQFLRAWEAAGKGANPQAEEPLWLAVLSLDRAVRDASRDGKSAPTALRDRLAQTATIFLQTFPQSEKAARLAVMQSEIGAISEDEALRVLSDVPRESPVYEGARRQVSRILYNRFRNARGQDKDFAAQKFLSVAEDLLVLERSAAMASDAKAGPAAAERAIIRARQMLDALLSVSSPDVRRAESVLQTLRGIAAYNNTDLRVVDAELTFRELQIALVLDDAARMEIASSRMLALSDSAGAFGPAADRLIYRNASTRWRSGAQGSNSDIARQRELIITFGNRIIERDAGTASALSDPSMVTLVSTVAAAAFEKWETSRDDSLRALALKLDDRLLEAKVRLEPSLKRKARLAEDAGDATGAVAAWQMLAEGVKPGTDGWMEARYEAARILAKVDVAKARELLGQAKALYSDFGSGPWASKMRELDKSLVQAAPASSTSGAGAGSGNSSPKGTP
jgi:hypothetical protein